MGLLSDLVTQGRIRNREDLRRVYRRLVKKLHPDSVAAHGERKGDSLTALPKEAPGYSPARRPVDFAALRRELEEAERLLAETDAEADVGIGRGRPAKDEGAASGPAPRSAKAAERKRERTPTPQPAHGKAATGKEAGALVEVDFDPGLLAAELRDLVARGFPVQTKALSRNKAYRDCVAVVSAQLALLTKDARSFARADAEMRSIRSTSFTLLYHVMQVLWNGLDWRLSGLPWMRREALRELALVRGELSRRGLRELPSLLSWIVDEDFD